MGVAMKRGKSAMAYIQRPMAMPMALGMPIRMGMGMQSVMGRLIGSGGVGSNSSHCHLDFMKPHVCQLGTCVHCREEGYNGAKLHPVDANAEPAAQTTYMEVMGMQLMQGTHAGHMVSLEKWKPPS